MDTTHGNFRASMVSSATAAVIPTSEKRQYMREGNGSGKIVVGIPWQKMGVGVMK